jgi:hypothetical protein
MLTIKDTTGQDTITCINSNGEVFTVSGVEPSVFGNLIASHSSKITNFEYLILKQELEANIASGTKAFTVEPGTTFINTDGSLSNVSYFDSTLGNVILGGGI